MDVRNTKLAELLVNYSMEVRPGNNVLIENWSDGSADLVCELVKAVYAVGAKPYVNSRNERVRRELLIGCEEEQIKTLCERDLEFMKKMDCYVSVRRSENSSELSDVPTEKTAMFGRLMQPLQTERVDNTRWVVLRYPSPSMAERAGMSSAAFKDFYYNVCTLDYAKMEKAMRKLKERLEKAETLRLTGPGTDLTMSIKNMPAIICAGDRNIPDGEVFTAPLRESVNGVISFNTPSKYQGFTYENIRFEIKDGRIVEAAANDNEKINKLLDSDEGARYFGEFAIGVNPYILEPMLDTLFDEKICGSIHFTPGQCYEECSNGNDSSIHWDLVLIQRPEYGGGELYLDGELIRKDGVFVSPDLECLNPENLV